MPVADVALSVPVSIDAIRLIDEERMARATYWVVAAIAPIPGWTLALAGEQRLHVLGDAGVVYRSNAPDGRFGAGDLTALFTEIEADPSLSIETEDVWLPLRWLDASDEPKRGEVFRVPLDAFHAAYRYRTFDITTAELLAAAPAGAVSPSPDETEAFRAWADAQIDEAKRRYPKAPELELTYER